jgi:2,5-furandicarboxylate decarboxylase 1
VTRALGKLHADEKLWQDPRGRLCVRGSAFAAVPPGGGGSANAAVPPVKAR